jgi:hypothetical protein
VERGNTKHGARQDDALAEELAGQLGPGGSNREEWAEAEPPADDDPQVSTGPTRAGPGGGAPDQAEAEIERIQHDLATAQDWHGTDDPPPGR